MDFSSTIAAIATPAGVSATGMIRVSGENTLNLLQNAFRGKNLEMQESHTMHFGRITDKHGQTIDEVVVGIFKAPKSFTGENVAEISCHGSPYILQKVMERLYEVGIRQAAAGEFTKRAFLNGKMDLTKAEAVGDLIHSESQGAHLSAINQLKGGISEKIRALREELVKLTSLLELELDFGEEDVEFADRTHLTDLLGRIKSEVKTLIASFSTGKMVKNGVQVAIVGKPNAGKSTLLNAILKEEKAIVSSVAGTTRDVIEDVAEIGGILFRFFDTAGLRETTDEVEGIGIERARKKMEQAHLIIYLYDVNEMSKNELDLELNALPSSKPLVVVGNKIDLAQEVDKNDATQIYISSKALENIKALEDLLLKEVGLNENIGDYSHVTTLRHAEALRRIDNAIIDIERGFEMGISSELIIMDIKLALEAMGEITGEVTNDEILGSIFSKFCIGK
ncbi:MAG: tRNA uridine-5-carboxymethylaminomethyl(34) synthesis GTPase MnmE [Bacteroidia bacterium]